MLSTFISFIDTLKRVTALTINGTRFSAINCTFLTLLVFALMGCSTERWYPKAAAEEVREQDLGGFPLPSAGIPLRSFDFILPTIWPNSCLAL